jgi:hypothetical protein
MTEKPLGFMVSPTQAPAERLSENLRWIEKAPEIPPRTQVSIAVTIWLTLVNEFRDLEEQFLINGQFESSLSDHRQRITELIAQGEKLVLRTKEHGLSQLLPIKVEDVEATVESLHITFRGQHRNTLPSDRKKVISELLGVS